MKKYKYANWTKNKKTLQPLTKQTTFGGCQDFQRIKYENLKCFKEKTSKRTEKNLLEHVSETESLWSYGLVSQTFILFITVQPLSKILDRLLNKNKDIK